MKNRDNLHFRWRKQFSYNKTWNFVIGERESGKSVDSWLSIWSAWKYKNRPSIVLRRRIADITSAYIDDTENVLNKFLEKPVQLLYLKGDIKQGVIDVKIGELGKNYSYAEIKKLPLFIRIIALSLPMNRIKSLMVKNIRYMFMDEFICNVRSGESYLKGDEYFLLKEIYTTYNREAETPIRIIAAANPYSVYTPLFVGLDVDTRKLKPGAFIVGPDYTINCFKVCDELKKKILAANPMYSFDDAYLKYAFNGEAVNDANINLQKFEPKGFKMIFIFKMGREFISIHRKGTIDFKYSYWACKHDSDWAEKISKRRKITVFSFGDMMQGGLTIMHNHDQKVSMLAIRAAMEKGDFCFNCIDASYMMEDIYDYTLR